VSDREKGSDYYKAYEILDCRFDYDSTRKMDQLEFRMKYYEIDGTIQERQISETINWNKFGGNAGAVEVSFDELQWLPLKYVEDSNIYQHLRERGKNLWIAHERKCICYSGPIMDPAGYVVSVSYIFSIVFGLGQRIALT
jgi:hypothetical protein